MTDKTQETLNKILSLCQQMSPQVTEINAVTKETNTKVDDISTMPPPSEPVDDAPPPATEKDNSRPLAATNLQDLSCFEVWGKNLSTTSPGSPNPVQPNNASQICLA